MPKSKNKIEKFFFNCSVCGSKSFLKIYGVSVFNVSLCRNCGVVCLNPRMDEKGCMEGFVKDYRAECFGGSLVEPIDIKEPYDYIEEEAGPNKVFNDIRKYLSPESRILEIGCGQGEVLIMLKKNNFNNLTGIDPFPDYCKRLQNFYDIECAGKSLLEFVAGIDKNKKFDCIILSHVLEHFVEPDKALEIINNLLEPEGILYLGTPDLYRWSNAFSQFSIPHTFYFTDKTLKMILKKSGFIVKKYFEDVNPTANEIVLLAEKKQTNNPARYNPDEYKKVLAYLKKDRLIYTAMTTKRAIEEFIITIFGENTYLSIRNFLKKIAIKVIKKYRAWKKIKK